MSLTQTMPCVSEMRSSNPIYPNALPSVPKPHCPSRVASLVLNNLLPLYPVPGHARLVGGETW
jgi:hypothetical protein